MDQERITPEPNSPTIPPRPQTITCSCGKRLSIKAGIAGKKFRCPGCKQILTVPAGEATQSYQDSLSGQDPSQPTLSGERAENKELYDFLAPPESDDEIGRLGGYRVLAVLGRGGMGVVFKAEDPNLHRLVALKAMLPSLATSPSAKERFFREARSAAKLKHPHIVTIFQVGEDRGAPFLAMEFLEGESLDDKLRREKPLAIPEVLRIGRNIGEGLAAAHAKGLIHRDIKPANIWLETVSEPRTSVSEPFAAPLTDVRGSEAHVKILDFGLARALSDQANLTQSGAIIGTPAYMAPEQAGGRAVDLRCDLFSLGCVLYRMCTGEMPFKGTDTISILSALATDNPPTPATLNPDVPADLSELVMKLLAKNPEERPESAHAVVHALQIIGEQTVSTGVDRPDRTKSRKASRKRLPRSWVMGGAAFCLGALGLIWFFLSRPNEDKTVGGKNQAITGVNGNPLPAIAPFNANKAKEYQDAWAKHLGVPEEIENSLGMKFRLIPPGQFKMGTPQEELEEYIAQAQAAKQPDYIIGFLKKEAPYRTTSIDEAFYFGIHEVTQKAWQTVMGNNPSSKTGAGDLPVENILWLEALTFCNRLSEREGRSSCYQIDGDKVELLKADGYRLPTIDEWEFACRAGSTTKYFFGDDPAPLGEYAWFAQNSAGHTHPVGLKRANPFGLHDINGNVGELAHHPQKSWTKNKFQPTRGETYGAEAARLRSATHNNIGREGRAPWVGLRVLRGVSDPKLPPSAGSSGRYALRLNGGNDHVQIPVQYAGTGDLTVEAWVTLHVLEGYGTLFHSGAAAVRLAPKDKDRLTAHLWQFDLSGQDVNGKKGTDAWYSGHDIEIDKQVHVAAVRRSGKLMIFVNGRLSGGPVSWGEGKLDFPFPVAAGNWTLGGDPSVGRGKSVKATVEEIRISKVARYDKDFTSAKRLEPDADSLALYHCDEGQGDVLKDSSGNGHDGKIIGAKWVKVNQSPIVGGDPSQGNFALSLDEKTQVTVPSVEIDLSGPVTLEAYVTSRDSEPRSFLGISNLLSLSHQRTWFVMVLPGPKPLAILRSIEPAVPGKRTHVAAVYTATQVRWFVDGVLQEGKSFASPLPTDKRKLSMPKGNFNGVLDEIRVSTVARYDRNFTPAQRHEPDADTLALYHCDEGQGDVLKDSSGNGHHGKIVGAKWVKAADPVASTDYALALDENYGVWFDSLQLDLSEPLTLEAYLTPHRTESAPALHAFFVMRLGIEGSGQPRWYFVVHGEKTLFDFRPTAPRPAVGKKTHLAGVFTGKELRFFIDGVSTASAEVKEKLTSKKASLTIGGGQFVGLIDEIRISRVARYDKNFTPAARFELDADTLALYHCDEAQGDILLDAGKNKHHGRFVVSPGKAGRARWLRADGSPISSTPTRKSPTISAWSSVR